MDAIKNTTGFSESIILDDFKPGNGPTISILNYPNGYRGGNDGIVFDFDVIEQFGEAKGDEAYNSVLATALTVLHEYGHYGDQKENEGNNSGQFSEFENKPLYDANNGKLAIFGQFQIGCTRILNFYITYFATGIHDKIVLH